MKKVVHIIVVFTIAMSMLAACNNTLEEAEENKITLKVLFRSEESFFQQYGGYYSAANSNVDFEVIETDHLSEYDEENDGMHVLNYDEKIKKLIEDEKPDIMILDEIIFKQFIEENRLYSLDELMVKDNFDIDNIEDSVLESLRYLGDGMLYGLAPHFISQALFYNKDLFDEKDVQYPTDFMTWEEVFDVAKLFSTEHEKGAGLLPYSNMSISELIMMMGNVNELYIVDEDSLEVTMNTEPWTEIFETVIKAYQSGAVYTKDQVDDDEHEQSTHSIEGDFAKGNIAMTIGDYWMVDDLKRADYNPEVERFNWDIVTAPVDAEQRKSGGSIHIYDIFSINSQTEHIDAAWDFIQYVNGNEQAQIMAKANSSNLLSRKTNSFIESSDVNLDAFYKVSAGPTLSYDFNKFPGMFLITFDEIFEQEVQLAYEGEKTIEEALQSIQERGQEALDQEKRNENQ
ncbi:ABC transporter substrate-binding protein [Longirhabdus pacifica]|uniref:ABC transporter substrate-binding protein n=1 Tax=Longirhabdus pacifica TaxID=2305227 RepID=UPI0013E8AB4C|nr:ABC transporter substrate-binding protein [Longirhabdus pacifica]